MLRKSGFTLVEMLIVVVIVGIVSIAAIPSLLRAKLNSNESVVQQDLRTVSSAAEIYRSSQQVPVYPPNLAALGAENIPTLDPAIAAGMQHGYNFELNNSSNGDAYTCVANPIQMNITGSRSFCMDHNGVLKEYSEAVISDGVSCPANASLVKAQSLTAA